MNTGTRISFRKKTSRWISMLLTIVMLIQLIPSSVFATEDASLPEASVEPELLTAESTQSTGEALREAEILFEEESLREESVKHFRLDNGMYLAISYDMPVHYLDDDGTWQDYDNTLQPITRSGVVSAYRVSNGDSLRLFAADDAQSQLLALQKGDYSLALSPIPEPDAEIPVVPDDPIVAQSAGSAEPQEEQPGSIGEEVPETELHSATAPTEEAAAPVEEVTEPIESVTPSEAEEPSEALATEPVVEATEPVAEKTESTETAKTPTDSSTNQEILVPSTDEVSPNPAVVLTEVAPTGQPFTDPLMEAVQPELLYSALEYENVFSNASLRYENYANTVKESIVIPAPQNNYSYSFKLQTVGLTPTLCEDGSIILYTEQNEVIYTIPAPYLIDNADAYSYDAAYTLQTVSDGWILTVTADAQWINASDRVFPVLLDPSFVEVSENEDDIAAGFIRSGYPATQDLTTTGVYVGNNGEANGVTRSYFRINELVDLPDSCELNYAEFQLYHFAYEPQNSSATELRIGLHGLTKAGSLTGTSSASNWKSWAQGLTWNNVNAGNTTHSGIMIDRQTVSSSTKNTYVGWDITSLAYDWYTKENANMGFTLIAENELSSQARASFFSPRHWEYRPYMVVTYRSISGVEGIHTYQNMGIGRAGSGYLNDFSLQNTLVVPLVSAPSEILPFSLSAVYNSSVAENYFTAGQPEIHTADYSNMGLGVGWKLSVQETMIPHEDEIMDYIVYNDADGTEHYFYWDTDTEKYKDEDGLSLTVTGTQSQYTMTDDQGNQWIFINGYLTTYQDARGNALHYCYNGVEYSTNNAWHPTSTGANKVTSVVRVIKDKAPEKILVIGYNSNRVSTVIGECDYTKDEQKDERRIYIRHSTDSSGTWYLSEIEYPDGAKMSYTYNASTAQFYERSRLNSVYDGEANYGLEYTYSYNRDVSSVAEYYLDGTTKVYGEKMNAYKRTYSQTVYRYYGKNGLPASEETDTHDDLLLFKVFDPLGRTISSYTTDHTEETILGAGAASYYANEGTDKRNNRLLSSVSTGQQAVNLLKNSSIENNGGSTATVADWHGSSTRASLGATAYLGNYALKLSRTAAAADTDYHYQAVTLEANTTYTFSAYIHVPNTAAFSSEGGAWLTVVNTAGTVLASSETVNFSTIGTNDGWMRIYATWENATAGQVQARFCATGYTGEIYADALQLEKGNTPSTYNLINNGSFEQCGSSIPTGLQTAAWYRAGTATPVTGTDTRFGSKCVKIEGGDEYRRVSQNIPLNVPLDSTFVLSAWGKGNAIPSTDSEDPEADDPFFGLLLRLYYSDDTSDFYSFRFNSYYDGWQFLQGIAAPKTTTTNITITSAAVAVVYDNNINTAWMDNISLRLEPAQTYEFDENGKPKETKQTGAGKEDYEYNNGDLTKYTDAIGVKYNYTYNEYHEITTAVGAGITTEYTRNTSGFATQTTVTGGSKHLTASATQTYDGNHTGTVTDANGNSTTYEYNHHYGQVTAVTDGKLNTTYTTYINENGRVKQTYIDRVAAIANTYDKGALSALTRKTYNGDTPLWQRYTFSTNEWGQPTEIAVQKSANGSTWSTKQILSTKSYYEIGAASQPEGYSPGALKEEAYGNGATVKYYYDELDRLSEKRYTTNEGKATETVKSIFYTYNAESSVSKISYAVDGVLQGSYLFEYDSLGRLIRSRELDGAGDTVQRTEHLYDAYSRLQSQSWVVEGEPFSESYVYDAPDKTTNPDGDGSLKQMTTAAGNTIDYTYDELNRLHQETVKDGNVTILRSEYTYRDISGSQTTRQVRQRDVYVGTSEIPTEGKWYAYDPVGNISGIYTSTGTRYPLVVYNYDEQNQLIKETFYDGQGITSSHITATYEYTYDTAGNILSESKDGVVTKTYTYGNDTWQDLLTAINGNNIAYDNSGNPLTYVSGNGTGYRMSWTEGRQLAGFYTTSGAQAEVSYTYDADGIRTGKSVDIIAESYTTHKYITQNGKVVRETIGSGSTAKILDFIYDASGRPFALKYSEDGGSSFDTYYYVLNLQGDVVKLVEILVSGDAIWLYDTIANYSYNAWGELISVTDILGNEITDTTHIAHLNPLRYRGYYYDTETGFYYLQSRYYDPAMHRFINADSLASTGQGFVGTNMFAYCLNNPVGYYDPSGNACSSTEDNDGNGIPDYMDLRWRQLTAMYHARDYSLNTFDENAMVNYNYDSSSNSITCDVNIEMLGCALDEDYYIALCLEIEKNIRGLERMMGLPQGTKDTALTYEHIYQELTLHVVGYYGGTIASNMQHSTVGIQNFVNNPLYGTISTFLLGHCDIATLNYNEDRWYCKLMYYIPVPAIPNSWE